MQRRLAVLAAVLAACSAQSPEDPIDTDGIATSSPAASDSTTAPAESSSSATTAGSDTGASGDPDYPRPEPVADIGDCPEGFLGPITFDGTGWLCIPPCTEGDPPTCPDPASGDAQAQCATNPFSSATPCMDDNDCTEDGEACGNVGMEQMGCLLPPSHCLLRCDEGQACPDTMGCSPSIGLCQYLP